MNVQNWHQILSHLVEINQREMKKWMPSHHHINLSSNKVNVPSTSLLYIIYPHFFLKKPSIGAYLIMIAYVFNSMQTHAPLKLNKTYLQLKRTYLGVLEYTCRTSCMVHKMVVVVFFKVTITLVLYTYFKNSFL